MGKKLDNEVILAYKGFDADWKCRGFQYEVGKLYVHDGKVEACSSGFHACEYPLDVLGYYPPAGSKFAVVEQSGDLSGESENSDTKIASRNITIKEELDLPTLIKASFEWVYSKCDPVKSNHSEDYRSAASVTGNRSAASATGDSSAASATGDGSAALSTGSFSSSEICKTNKPQHAVAISTGCQGKSKAPYGSAIVCVFRNIDGELLHIRASKVGENGVKPDTWYTLNKDGNFIEA